jgi:hypothetical protein
MIPRQFHFFFGPRDRPEPLHLVFYLCLESCRQLHPASEIFVHCHHEPFGPYWELIKAEPAVHFVAIRPDPFAAGHPADVARLDALIKYGGIYADIDTLFVNAMPSSLLQHRFVIGREDDVACPRTGELKPSLCSAVVAAERGAPFARALRERLRGAFDGTWSHAGFLRYALSQELPGEVHVEPPRTFYRHGPRPAGVKMLLEGLDTDFERMITMHLWSHLWWDRGRRDFSHVHQGLLTEDWIRAVDTTFTVAARRFLPPPDSSRRRAVTAMERARHVTLFAAVLRPALPTGGSHDAHRVRRTGDRARSLR